VGVVQRGLTPLQFCEAVGFVSCITICSRPCGLPAPVVKIEGEFAWVRFPEKVRKLPFPPVDVVQRAVQGSGLADAEEN
jgi:hypothetical protein